MSALTKIEKISEPLMSFNDGQLDLLKNTICKGASNDELMFFVHVCEKTGLNPFAKQIYSVPRGGQRVIQISVDGFRMIAERTGRYAPGRESTYTYDKDGNLFSATSYVKKQTRDGTWHEVAATAFFSEYDGKNPTWKKMPHVMLAKCAECIALRKAFPAEMSGCYGEEEMHQADVKVETKHITTWQALELTELLNACDPIVRENAMEFIKKKFSIEIIDDLPASEFDKYKKTFTLRRDEYQKKIADKPMRREETEKENLSDEQLHEAMIQN